MRSLLTVSLPLAIGAALSPTLFVTTMGILKSRDQPRRRAIAFLLGALLPIGLLIVVAFTAVGPVLRHAEHDLQSVLGYIDLALGVLLLVVAARWALHPPAHRRHKEAATRPVWWTLVLGAILEGRDVHSMALAFGALQHAAVAHVGSATKVVATAVIVVIVTLPVWLPIVVRVSIPAGLLEWMARTQRWAQAHEQLIVVTVCLVFGVYLLVRGALGS